MSEINTIFYFVGGIGGLISVCICYKMCNLFRNARRKNIDNMSNQITTDINSVSLKSRNYPNSTCSTLPQNTIHPFSLGPDKYTENITKLPQAPPPSPVSNIEDIEDIEVYTASNDVKEKYIKMLISEYICNNNYSITENDIRIKYNNFRTSKNISDFKMKI